MPKEGFTTITIPEPVYKKVKKFIEEYNNHIGFKRFRSVSHLTEEAVAEFLKEKRKEARPSNE